MVKKAATEPSLTANVSQPLLEQKMIILTKPAHTKNIKIL